MAERHVFSTGVLRIGAPGSSALATDGTTTVGVIQDVTLETSFSRKELFDAAQNSVFAVDAADHEGKFVLKFTTDDISEKLIPYCTGAVKSTGTGAQAGQNVYTIGGTSKPQFCRIEFDGVDTNGKNIHIIMPKAKPMGIPISAKINDYASAAIEIPAYADQANSNLVATIGLDQ